MNSKEFQSYTPFFRALYENRYLRRQFLQQIQDVFKVSLVISYISIGAPIDELDPIIFQEPLYEITQKVNSILLILHSDGGSPDVAEKLVDIIRENTRKFYVVIPERAKSAATLLSLGADKIFMLENAELGPIDPQIKIKDSWRPAQSVIDGVKAILDLMEKRESIHPGLAVLLQNIDPATLDFALKAIERTKV